VVDAARGTRNLDDRGSQPIEDPTLARALRKKAGRVWVKTLLLTLAGTALLYALPL